MHFIISNSPHPIFIVHPNILNKQLNRKAQLTSLRSQRHCLIKIVKSLVKVKCFYTSINVLIYIKKRITSMWGYWKKKKKNCCNYLSFKLIGCYCMTKTVQGDTYFQIIFFYWFALNEQYKMFNVHVFLFDIKVAFWYIKKLFRNFVHGEFVDLFC